MIINKLFKLLKKSLQKECVPVSAVVVKNNKILSQGYNLKEKTHNPLDHAEIIAIKNAAKKLKTWKLSECELYITMNPCKMCRSVIEETRIKKVYFLCENTKEKNKINNIKYIKIKDGANELEYIEILKNFFKNKRK